MNDLAHLPEVKCLSCKWSGPIEKLDFIRVYSCPLCHSMKIYLRSDLQLEKQIQEAVFETE